ncbi:MAG: hypothetical protein A2126_04505 [Candidatus Woykebacteria bacterium GWB1_45_5]|uniref:Uncharacterized protein n=2 Tax=Candidatus Woykeibacteriota TaxID=1817899 RepID=A0A1G1W067_9BACT|nr:MAG: hypothetical protein A2113_02890 [Candidatus Woykebacteria bacterium GWA1_44_8]OGY22731.1 MAG: hypothetical protein A2126_04505 [Candidatus Woykebacteria bacterium GWB1_45_5]
MKLTADTVILNIVQEISLSIKPKEDKLKTIVVSLIFVIIFALVAFTAGLQLGKTGQFATILKTEPVATKSAAPTGWQLLDEAGFSIAYPKDWEAKANPAGEPEGAKIKSIGGKVELWLLVAKPYTFSEEQAGKQTGKNEGKMKVDGREGTLAEFTYDTGGYYLVVEVPATLTAPMVTFWATAGNDDYKKVVLDIINSFQSKVETQKAK